MNYPLITEYLQAIMSASDNLDKLSRLRPVLDSYGEPMRSVGAFAVVFKMQDSVTGQCYALKCFTEEQSGRAEAYRMIAEELSAVDSPYLAKVEYYEKELFVDSSCSNETEFPVLLMDWIEGKTMEQYVRENYGNELKMQWLCYRFSRMASWLRCQPFAHGDIKPDNLIVREDGTLTLVDYDGMYVPAMKGQKSPTLGTRDFSHPEREADDFDDTIDDFALVATSLSLKAIALDADLYADCGATDRLLFSADDYRDLSRSAVYAKLQRLLWDKEFATLMGQFNIAYSQKSLQQVSFRLFNLSEPAEEELDYDVIDEMTPNSDFNIRFKDGNCVYFRIIDDDAVKAVDPGIDIFGLGGWSCYPSPQGCLVIPGSVINKKKYSVTEIGDSAFSDCSALQHIVIPDSVTKIGDSAFSRCSALQHIVIPDSVTEIGDSAFSSCSALQHIVIPDSVTKIENDAFSGCSALQHIVIPDSVTKIGEEAFRDCSALQHIVIPDSVTKIGNSAFDDCSALQHIVIPDSVTKIENDAFCGCSALQHIVIPDSVTKIGEEAFRDCIALQHIVIPDSVIEIGDSAFFNCSALQSIIVSENNPRYDSRDGCNAIIETSSNKLITGCVNTVIPDSVIEIGEWAFSRCSALQHIVIPDSVTKIGNSAFSGCSALQHIVIPDSVTEIGECAFEDCSALQHIVIPDSVIEIGKWAFRGCSALQHIVIPDSVTKIGGAAFRDCSALQHIVVPDSVTKIGEWAFSGCSALQHIVIPDSVIEIEFATFSGCSALQHIFIPDSVTEIGEHAFSGCSALQSIIVSENNPRYDSRDGCNAIIETSSNELITGCVNTVIPDSVTKIGEWAFSGCSALQHIVIPDSVTEIGDSAFSDCSALQHIVIPDSVTEIGDSAFSSCSALQHIVIPDSVTEIGDSAFSGCSALQHIDIPDSVTKIGVHAFFGCSDLQHIVIPDSVTEIGVRAFSGCSGLLSISIKNAKLLKVTWVDVEKVKIIS